MHKTLLPFEKVPQLSKTDLAYASGDPALKPFFAYEPRLDAMPSIMAKRSVYSSPRKELVEVLYEQYADFNNTEFIYKQIDSLLEPEVYTVTTAHQPTLFAGPLYFVYKAVSTIRLAERTSEFTGKKVIPVFVLGSEDHDLAELNHIHLFGKRIEWQPGEQGAVGSMRAESVAPVLEELRPILGDSTPAQDIMKLFEQAYRPGQTFAQATQNLLHALFGGRGLVVLNMNHPVLKRLFIPFMRAELLTQNSQPLVQKTVDALAEAGFKAQANPRAINLFYLNTGIRERIVQENGLYKVLNTNIEWTEIEILEYLEAHPEHFSPNVVLRPVFQEFILPNLAYVGGGGELAYWLERKAQFEALGVPFPMLVRRNSVLWLDKDALKRIRKAQLSTMKIFEDTALLIRQFIESQAAENVDLGPEMAAIAEVYVRIAAKAAAVDPTLEKAVFADGVKLRGALEQWQSRLLRAEKQKHEQTVQQIRNIKDKLFPDNGLQERTDHFLPYFLKSGFGFFDILFQNLDPFEEGFVILEEEEKDGNG
ncbi:MAG: bacillithiol biosynthesis cysteine-adding enzyme BshC [Bacteroidetes bacterium]|nr:bacillithiol biosynthesis cysteine-adding enzyme BshC [Bacteroidota bacterium]